MISIPEKTLPIPSLYIQQMKETPQNPRYHAEGNVYNHTMLVLDEVLKQFDRYELSEADKEVLYWAAILHDIGKPAVTHWEAGRWVAHGHEEAGVPIARNLLLQQTDLSADQRRRILNLVRWHSIPLRWGLRKATINEYKLLATRTDLRLLGIFSYADIAGRDCVRKEEVLSMISQLSDGIFPAIEEEMGNYDQLHHLFNKASRQHKNALWQSLKSTNADLLQKLLQPKQTLSGRPAQFECVMSIGVPGCGKTEYLRDTFPAARHVELKDFFREGDPHHVYQNKLRQLRYAISAYARSGGQIVLDGMNLHEIARIQLNEFVRSLEGSVRYLFFDRSIDDLLPQTDHDAQLKHHYRLLQPVHPWEAHRIEWV